MALSLASACAVVRTDATPYRADREREVFMRELTAPFGVVTDEERIRRGTNVGFTELAEAALGALPVRICDPDLLILAYALPDIVSFRHVAADLNHRLGGRSHSFAVSEQGLRAPYTALRVAEAYRRSGRCRTLALFVCEQHTFAYRDPFVEDNRLTNSGVLLYFDDGGGYEFRTTSATSSEGGLGDLLRTTTSGTDPAATLVVAGPWVTADVLRGLELPVHRGGEGTYCTSVWLELARHHRTWADRYRWVALCDTDPRTGWSQTALLRLRTPDPRETP